MEENEINSIIKELEKELEGKTEVAPISWTVNQKS